MLWLISVVLLPKYDIYLIYFCITYFVQTIIYQDIRFHHDKVITSKISLNTVKIRMQYKSGIFVGSMAGMEFVVQENTLPRQFQEYKR